MLTARASVRTLINVRMIQTKRPRVFAVAVCPILTAMATEFRTATTTVPTASIPIRQTQTATALVISVIPAGTIQTKFHRVNVVVEFRTLIQIMTARLIVSIPVLPIRTRHRPGFAAAALSTPTLTMMERQTVPTHVRTIETRSLRALVAVEFRTRIQTATAFPTATTTARLLSTRTSAIRITTAWVTLARRYNFRPAECL